MVGNKKVKTYYYLLRTKLIMKIVAILNPTSGNKDSKALKKHLLRRFFNFNFEIWETEKPFQAIDLSKKAVQENCDIIIAAGGDGTIIEVISGMINSNSKLGIIPYGTGNMLAANLGIPVNISKAIDIIIEGNSQKIDIGKINDRYFAFMAGCGFDAKIIDETSREKKKKYGLLAYFIEGVSQVFKTKYNLFKIKLDNNKTVKARALTVIIANSGNIIGNLFSLVPHASLSDGLLDIIIISPKSTGDYIPILWQILTRQKHKKSNKIIYYQAKEVEIKCKPNLPVQADGDIIGKTPIKVQALPQAIEVLTPKIPYNIPLLSVEDHLRGIINFALQDLS
jgi:YegS/Rv2252/BmrU family lipid kinase